MAGIKLTDLCRETGKDRKEVEALRRKLGIARKKIGNAYGVSKADAEILRKELELPEELNSDTYYAFGIHPALNPAYLMCAIEGFEGKHPVLLPRRFWGRLERKRFPVEKIEDAKGVTWRHEWFRKLSGYGR